MTVQEAVDSPPVRAGRGSPKHDVEGVDFPREDLEFTGDTLRFEGALQAP